MTKRVAMIPARLESKRIPRKNLRYLGDIPLLAWVVGTAIKSGCFDEVWVNSEAPEIQQLAQMLGAQAYRRRAELAQDGASSTHFVQDFINNVPCAQLYQVTPTSPFLTVEDLEHAVFLMELADTVLSVQRVQAETFIGLEPANFDPTEPMLPSQQLAPSLVMCNGVFGWTPGAFEKYGCYGHNRSFLMLDGDSALDIDTEDDWARAEQIVARRKAGAVIPQYWTPTRRSESSAAQVLKADGVPTANLDSVVPVVNVLKLLRDTKGSFAHRVVSTPSNCATIIAQQAPEGNRPHYHYDWDEWWYILEGTFEYWTEERTIFVSEGDVICIPRGTWHKIIAVGYTRATRLAVSTDNVAHVYAE